MWLRFMIFFLKIDNLSLSIIIRGKRALKMTKSKELIMSLIREKNTKMLFFV